MTNPFLALGLEPRWVANLTALGYTEPTPIQAQAIPLLLAGHDLLGRSQTGTGKTAAFGLPLLQSLDPDATHVQALVVTPTRELALQVTQALRDYARGQGVSILPVYGGQGYGPQLRALRRGRAAVVVGTPGRLLDLLQRGALRLDQVRWVVLDEADEMLSMGFIDDITTLLEATPPERQTALFSATLPRPVRALAEGYMRAPRHIAIQPQETTARGITQQAFRVRERDKLAALTRLLAAHSIATGLIFCRTRANTRAVAQALNDHGWPAAALHGDMSQAAREDVFAAVRRGHVRLLVATDVAARGLDIAQVSHVINYDLPTDPEVYIHRVGRTARAGKTGLAWSLVTPRERGLWRRIERRVRQRIPFGKLPSAQDIAQARQSRLLEQLQRALEEGVPESQAARQVLHTLVDQGHDPLTITLAALHLAQAHEPQAKVLPLHEPTAWTSERREHRRRGAWERERRPRRERREREPGMVRLGFAAGRMHGLRPGDVVGTLAYQARIPGAVIGRIQIGDDTTWVDVPQDYVDQVLAHDAFRWGRRTVKVWKA
ncbi:MAG: DEAD/DEAH box helicase [Chloroflexi bacterium]|nr:DEAD/DEAH box helicase [Chloroflexota bacterium]